VTLEDEPLILRFAVDGNAGPAPRLRTVKLTVTLVPGTPLEGLSERLSRSS
jgi:hypothetical protein